MKEKLNFDHSMKKIPITTKRSYLLKLIEQIEMVIYQDMKRDRRIIICSIF